MSRSLQSIVEDAVGRLADVPDDALGELRLRRFRPPVIVPTGRAWRLGSVLLTRDGTLYRAGRTARAYEPGIASANKSNEAEERRELARAAMRGKFPEGETIHIGYEVLDPSLVDGVWRIAWNPRMPDTVPLEGYLDERVRLLISPVD